MTWRWSRGQWALRVTMVAGIMLALVSTAFVGAAPAPWLIVLVLVLALGFARFPESHVGTLAMSLVIVWWGVSLRDGLHPQALVAAAGLLAAHVAALVSAYGPDSLTVDRATLALWVRRGLLVFLVAPGAWAGSAFVRGRAEPPGLWDTGLLLAFLVTLVASVALSRQEQR